MLKIRPMIRNQIRIEPKYVFLVLQQQTWAWSRSPAIHAVASNGQTGVNMMGIPLKTERKHFFDLMWRRQIPMTTREPLASRSSAPSTRWCRLAGICTSSCSPTATSKITWMQTTWPVSSTLSKRYIVPISWHFVTNLLFLCRTLCQSCLYKLLVLTFICHSLFAY